MTSSTLILYQSTLIDRPGTQRGWMTAPTVQEKEVSSPRLGLLPLITGSETAAVRIVDNCAGVRSALQLATRFGLLAITFAEQGSTKPGAKLGTGGKYSSDRLGARTALP